MRVNDGWTRAQAVEILAHGHTLAIGKRVRVARCEDALEYIGLTGYIKTEVSDELRWLVDLGGDVEEYFADDELEVLE